MVLASSADTARSGVASASKVKILRRVFMVRFPAAVAAIHSDDGNDDKIRCETRNREAYPSFAGALPKLPAIRPMRAQFDRRTRKRITGPFQAGEAMSSSSISVASGCRLIALRQKASATAFLRAIADSHCPG
jgi:hypothetical protein